MPKSIGKILLTVQWHSSASEIPDALWDACFPAPLEGKWWYETLERSGLDDQFTFFYAAVLEGEKPIAIAPAFIMNVSMKEFIPETLLRLCRVFEKIIPSLLTQRTLFVGSPCSDEGVVGIVPSANRAAILHAVHKAMLLHAKKHGASMVIWKDFSADNDLDMAELMHSEGLFRATSFPGTVVNISGGKEAYFARLNAKHRNLVKKKLRVSTEQVAVNIEIIRNPESGTLDEIFALFEQTYQRGGVKFERLTHEFFTEISAQPQSVFIMLREKENNALLAFMLCFQFPGHIINKFIGIDYARPPEWYLYFRLWEAALDWSMGQNARVIQSGQTGYRPKLDTGHSLVPLNHYGHHRNPLIQCIYRKIAAKISWKTLDKDLAQYVKARENTRD